MKTGAAVACLLLLAGCGRHRVVTREMEWDTEGAPNAVRLRFVENPNREMALGGVPELVEHLRRSGKRRIPVEFDVTCNWSRGGWVVQSFWQTRVDGQKVEVTSGGWSGQIGPGGDVDPLESACK